jgi:hypothetical protein
VWLSGIVVVHFVSAGLDCARTTSRTAAKTISLIILALIRDVIADSLRLTSKLRIQTLKSVRENPILEGDVPKP